MEHALSIVKTDLRHVFAEGNGSKAELARVFSLLATVLLILIIIAVKTKIVYVVNN